jgi:hypothetical protein
MDVQIPCPCPHKADGDTRHPDGDTVTLRDRMGFRDATTIRKAIGLLAEEGRADPAEILSCMTQWYAWLGIESWSLVDEKGKPVPVTRAEIDARLLEAEGAYDAAATITDAADALYMGPVLLPLVARASKSSPPMPTAPSISARTASPAKRPRPSKPSLTTSTRTDGIGTTFSSPAGASSTSPS